MKVGKLLELLEGMLEEDEIKIGINPGQGEGNEEVFEIEDVGYSQLHKCKVIWQGE